MALCYTNNLSFNHDKTKEIDFKRNCTSTALLLSFSSKEFQALHVREPSSACTSPPVRPSLYKGTVTSCLSVLYGNCWFSDQEPLKRESVYPFAFWQTAPHPMDNLSLPACTDVKNEQPPPAVATQPESRHLGTKIGFVPTRLLEPPN
ncbi:unnamed protein product [Pleuronectes platessa]|uniref:Uncharacterized protein n=1 Tax=Pleuronectes platessa TaxID=8262 RepID=A0A9N7UT64_PLEPL|nr:unnamed protein product [Pleuronectes platessa]